MIFGSAQRFSRVLAAQHSLVAQGRLRKPDPQTVQSALEVLEVATLGENTPIFPLLSAYLKVQAQSPLWLNNLLTHASHQLEQTPKHEVAKWAQLAAEARAGHAYFWSHLLENVIGNWAPYGETQLTLICGALIGVRQKFTSPRLETFLAGLRSHSVKTLQDLGHPALLAFGEAHYFLGPRQSEEEKEYVRRCIHEFFKHIHFFRGNQCARALRLVAEYGGDKRTVTSLMQNLMHPLRHLPVSLVADCVIACVQIQVMPATFIMKNHQGKPMYTRMCRQVMRDLSKLSPHKVAQLVNALTLIRHEGTPLWVNLVFRDMQRRSYSAEMMVSLLKDAYTWGLKVPPPVADALLDRLRQTPVSPEALSYLPLLSLYVHRDLSPFFLAGLMAPLDLNEPWEDAKLIRYRQCIRLNVPASTHRPHVFVPSEAEFLGDLQKNPTCLKLLTGTQLVTALQGLEFGGAPWQPAAPLLLEELAQPAKYFGLSVDQQVGAFKSAVSLGLKVGYLFDRLEPQGLPANYWGLLLLHAWASGLRPTQGSSFLQMCTRNPFHQGDAVDDPNNFRLLGMLLHLWMRDTPNLKVPQGVPDFLNFVDTLRWETPLELQGNSGYRRRFQGETSAFPPREMFLGFAQMIVPHPQAVVALVRAGYLSGFWRTWLVSEGDPGLLTFGGPPPNLVVRQLEGQVYEQLGWRVHGPPPKIVKKNV